MLAGATPTDNSVELITDLTEGNEHFNSKDNHRGLYTPLALSHMPALGMGRLTAGTHAPVLGSLQPQLLYVVWSGILAYTSSSCDSSGSSGHPMAFASDFEPC